MRNVITYNHPEMKNLSSGALLSLLLCLWAMPLLAQHGRTTPNIVLILADDLGKYDLSVYGGQNIRTPHMDSLARSGAFFRQGYAMAAVCSPSRMALLSGQYHQRWGYDFQPHQRYPRNALHRWFARRLMARDGWIPDANRRVPSRKQVREHGIPDEAFTLAERLKEQGYRTGLFGKWHLGYAPTHHPLRHGFDQFYGFIEAYSLFLPRKDPRVVNAPVPIFADKVQWKKRKGATAILRGEQPIREDRYLTDAIAEEAIAFMQPQGGQPFFAMLSFSAPHAPWQAPKELYDSLAHITNHHRRVYYAMIQSLDMAVGRVVAHLREQGLLEQTLIVFTSDNGIVTYNGHLDPAPHQGGKLSLFEGGVNVPLCIAWPGVIAPGQVLEEMASHLDIAATIAGAAGADAADRLDGRDLLPALSGVEAFPADAPLFWRAGPNKAVRSGRYKAIIDEMSKVIFLFDLEADPSETDDLSNRYPEVLEELRRQLVEWESQMRTAAWPHVINYRVVINGQEMYFAT